MKISHRDITDEQRVIGNTIVFDDGSEIPAFARWAYHINGMIYGCESPMPFAQREAVHGLLRWGARLSMRRVDGSAFVTKVFPDYVPGIWRIYPDGCVTRVDRPYGNGTEAS